VVAATLGRRGSSAITDFVLTAFGGMVTFMMVMYAFERRRRCGMRFSRARYVAF